FCLSGVSSSNGPFARRPVSSLNSRLAQASRSSDSTLPLGIDQAPSSLFCQYGPPGWARRISNRGLRREGKMAALSLDRRDTLYHHGRSSELVTCSRSGDVKHTPTQR